VILCILLISLWNKKPVWDVNLRFPNLLLILVIINSILIFKSIIFARSSEASTKAGKQKIIKTSKSLHALRSTVIQLKEFSSQGLEKVLEKIRQIASCDSVAIYSVDNGFYSSRCSAGTMPAALSGAILTLKEDHLWIKFPGNLGEEKICKIVLRTAPLTFRSSITRLEFTLFPLKMINKQIGLLVFSCQKDHQLPKISYSGIALYLETLLAFLDHNTQTGDPRYVDKSTGLLNFDCFEESFETEIERSERYQQEMTLLSARIEFDEKISETLLKSSDKAAAIALKQSLRRLDLMFAGETEHEFLAILTETGSEVSKIVAGRIQKSFAKYLEKEDIDTKALKLHIGSASYPTNATHGHGLLEKSKDSMQQAINENLEFYAYNLNE
jgi:GGDEF domain-containing protein